MQLKSFYWSKQFFTTPAGLTETIVVWKFKGFSKEKIRSPHKLNNSLSPKLKVFTPRNVVSLFIDYELDT